MNQTESQGRTPYEQILPGFYRDAANQLYACHHSSIGPPQRREAALICNPVGHEYERCHRALRQLAVQFARSGLHAMRFDYSGTGDSAGDYGQASLAKWRADVNDSIDECKRQAGVARVCVVGLRLGATLAAQVAANRDDVESLVLFAPVMNGRSLLSEWEQEQAKHHRKHTHAQQSTALDQVLGYPLSRAFRDEINEERLLPEPNPALRRVLVLAEDVEDQIIGQFADTLGSRGADVTIVPVSDAAIWRREPLEAIVPFKLLRHIVKWALEDKP